MSRQVIFIYICNNRVVILVNWKQNDLFFTQNILSGSLPIIFFPHHSSTKKPDLVDPFAFSSVHENDAQIRSLVQSPSTFSLRFRR